MIIFVGEKFAVVDSVMTKFVHIDGIVGFPAIGVDDRIWLNFAGYDGYERAARRIGNNFRVDFTAAF